MKPCLLLLLSLVYVPVQAQDYLVTTRKDTLRGKLSLMSFEKVDKAMLSVNKKKTDYPAYSVLFIYMDSTKYVPVRTVDAFRFMKLSKSGMVSLCFARQSAGTPYNIPYLVKKSGESMEVNALRFKRTISNFLAECSWLKDKIEEEELGRDDLEKIIDTYNTCLEQQSTVAFLASEDPKLSALNSFNKKLGEDTTVPEDAKEILKDLYIKVKDGKPVPTYLSEGLRQSLKDFPAYQEDLEKLLAILKK